MRTCTVDGCEKPLQSRGWCMMHYARVRAHGNPSICKSNRHIPVSERFWAKVQKGPGCWLWTGAVTANNYGNFSGVRAHRFAYEELVGPIPEGMSIDHRCHTRLCVNPDHLRPVTPAQNSQNRKGARRGNATGVRGVIYRKGRDVYEAQVGHEGAVIHAGTFSNIEDAEAAAIALRNKLFTHNDADRISA